MNYFAMMLLVGGVAFVSSCGDDEPPVIPVATGIPVGDGLYITKAGVDPTTKGQLKSATVDAPNFGAMDRAGFVQGYLYLEAGSYNMVQIVSKEIDKTYGGSVEAVTEVFNGECETSGYSLVNVAVDGDAFNVVNAGLYVVGYDADLGELIYDQIESAGIIGGATPGGWGTDTPMTGTVDANGGSWEVTDVTLGVDAFKFRFNCRWAIDRRLDTNSEFANDNGYSMFTNFGNAVDNLKPGNEGPNMAIDERANYTVTMAWDTTAGFSATLTRTGDAPVLGYPDAMYLVGAGTTYGWADPGDDTHAEYVPGAEMHKIAGGAPNEGVYWKILHLEAGQGFKISALSWAAPNLGHGDVDEYDANGVAVTENEGNMDIATSGMYMVVLDLRNETRKVSIVTPEVYGMGDGAFTSWDEDLSAHLFTVDNTAKTLISPALSGAGGIRSYVHHAWISDWWNAEFIPNGGVIEYRNDGGDPANVTAAVGQVITYTFDDNTATVQ